MKYCIHYFKECDILNKADEISIKYERKDPELINFVDKWESEQRILINIITLSNEEIENNLNIFEATKEKHNIAIIISKYQPYKLLLEKSIPFFFIEGAYCLDELQWQIEQGVSDVYIINELGFFLKDIRNAYADKVNIRVYPNICQAKYTEASNLKGFFIRPEDIEAYENYVDVFEFASGLEQQRILYKIYHDEGKWNGKLNILISGISSDYDTVNNETIIPNFGAFRCNCRKKCVFNKCHICDRALSFSEILKDEDLKIIKEDNDLN